MYDPTTKRQSAEWVSPKKPKPSKVRMEKSRVKTMFIIIFNTEGVIHCEFVPEGQTVNGQFYLFRYNRTVTEANSSRPTRISQFKGMVSPA
jgi:hypothetical protein